MNIEELLYEEESATLDFKEEQYPFIHEKNPHVRCELLKDILAFANAWRQSDAYILIGVREVKGTKSEVIGIEEDIDDASLQQFINQKLNRAILFEYKTITINLKKVAYIKIPVQKRPFFTKKDYGKVRKNIVYLRRGSSTDEANPDEISEMGEAKAKVESLPLNPANYKIVAELTPISLNKELDRLQEQYRRANIESNVNLSKMLNISSFGIHKKPKELYDAEMSEYKEKLLEYVKQYDKNKIIDFCKTFERITYLVKFTIENIGNISDTDINIEIINENGKFIKEEDIYLYRKYFPTFPKQPSSSLDSRVRMLVPSSLDLFSKIYSPNSYRKYQEINNQNVSITLRDMHVGDKIDIFKDMLFLQLEETRELTCVVKSKESTSLIRKKVELVFLEDRRELDEIFNKEESLNHSITLEDC